MCVTKLNAHAKVTEVHSVGNQILAALEKSKWDTDSYLPAIIAELNAVTTDMNNSIRNIKSESLLEEKDTIRDEKIRAINYMLAGFAYYPSKEIKAASEVVLKVFNHYGISIISESYTIESSLINSLITDFEAAEVKTEIEKLPALSLIIEELKIAQAEFEEAEQMWNKVKTDDTKSATELKKELLNIINGKIVMYLKVVSVLDADKFTTIATEINEFIVTANRAVNRR